MKKSELRQIVKEEVRKVIIKEASSDEDYDKYQPKFEKFIRELRKLSIKYGIAVSGTFSYGDIKDIIYDTDFSSGDIDIREVDWGD